MHNMCEMREIKENLKLINFERDRELWHADCAFRILFSAASGIAYHIISNILNEFLSD